MKHFRYLLIFIFIFQYFFVFAQDKNIVILIAQQDYRDEELAIPKQIFEENGYNVKVVSKTKEKATGMLGDETAVDLPLSEVNIEDYDALILVGGAGAQVYWNDEAVLSLIKEAYSKRKIIGAICIAPVSLANAGILKGKKATVWTSESDKLISKGAEYISSEVVVDDNIVTADGPSASGEFAEKILEELKK
jgi:protease I